MGESNANSRLEAFCDAVFAIALTLLIIDVKIPSNTEINNTAQFWKVLRHIAPSIYAFLLSFSIILITWVNHHNGAKLISKNSPSFIYSCGFLLLTVVFIPFPTSLLGEYLFTDHAAPAVMLYNAVMALQAVGWILMGRTAIKGKLARNEKSLEMIVRNTTYGYYALVLYSVCTIVAYWFPLTIAVVTTIIWIFWLIAGITIEND